MQRSSPAVCETGEWRTSDGIELYRRYWLPDSWKLGGTSKDSRGASTQSPVVVILHGYGDHSGRYNEVAEFLVARGMAVLAYDALGHGHSPGQRGYIAAFDQYVGHAIEFIAKAQREFPGHPLVLLGHSNGGLVALRAVQRGLTGLAALVLSSPVVQLHSSRRPVPDVVAKWLSKLLPRLPLPTGLRPEDVTHDQSWIDRTRNDRLCLRTATPRWYWEARLAGQRVIADASKVQIPTLVICAEADTIAVPQAMMDLVEAFPHRNKELWVRPGAFHEPLNETCRVSLFDSLAAWIEKQLPG